MNPFGSLARAGVTLAFGTDAPVTPVAGWAMVRDAVQHSRPDERLPGRGRLRRGDRGRPLGRRAETGPGRIAVGWRADLAVWDVPALGPRCRLPRLDAGRSAARVRAHRGRRPDRLLRERPGQGWVGSRVLVPGPPCRRSAPGPWWRSLAGVALGLTWQPYGWWPLLVVAHPGVHAGRTRSAAAARRSGSGYLFGLGMLTVAVSWLHVLGVWVAALLILFEALFFGLLGILLSLVGRLRWWPLAAAAAWVLVEFAYSRIPFGGFGWSRIAYAAVDTPLAGLLPLVGVAGLSFAVALVGPPARLDGAGRGGRAGDTGAPRVRPLVLAGAVVVAVLLLATGLRLYQVEPADTAAGSVQVGIVQGNIPGRGIEAMGRARSVTNNHLSETVDLMTRVRLGQVGPAGLPALAGELHRHRPDRRTRSPGSPWTPPPRSPVARSWSAP